MLSVISVQAFNTQHFGISSVFLTFHNVDCRLKAHFEDNPTDLGEDPL